jgi:MYXO-CTERM domain-containing protein
VPDVDETAGERRNAFPFTIPAGETRAIWAEVHVPADAAPGEYAGTVKVTWDGGEATVPVALTVWPFAIPSTSSLKSAFGMSWGTLVTAHGVQGDALSALRARYGALALEHRVTVSKIDDGNTNLDHLASYFGSELDGSAPVALPGAEMTALEYMGGGSGYGSWSSYFAKRGWTDRLFQYTCDEPPLTCAWSDIPARASAARAASPALRTLVTTTIDEANAQGVTSSIDIMVPVVNYLDDRSGSSRAGPQRAKYDAFLAGSPRRELWAYQSCMSHGCGGTVNMGSPTASDRYYTGWPSYVIDSSAVRNRAMEWLSFRYDVSGELYYETTMAYTHDAWSNQWDFSGNGDGTLFYPGTPAKIGGATDVPVASIRLKMIREGMEDYEYLKLLSDLGDPTLAHQIADGLFPNAYSTEQSPQDLMSARERIASRIVELGRAKGVIPATPASGATPVADPATTPGSAAGGCSAGGAGGLLALAGLAGALRRRRRGGR